MWPLPAATVRTSTHLLSNKIMGKSDDLTNSESSSSSKIDPVSGNLTESKDDVPRVHLQPLVKNKKRRWQKPLDQVRAIENALIFQSVLVVLFTLVTLWLSRGQPLLIASVWELSMSICFCCFLWVCFLKVTMRVWMVFLSLSNGILLAIVVHLTLGPKVGMITVHLNTHFAAGFVGYALAEHRLKTTAKYVIAMPTSMQQEDKLHIPRIVFGLYIGVATLGAVVGVACVVYHAADYATNDLLLYVLMPSLGVLVLWIIYVDGLLLRGVFIGGGMALVFAYYGLIMMVYMLSLINLGHTAVTITVWISILGYSGFLGYSFYVYDSHKEILSMRYVQRRYQNYLSSCSF